MRLCIAALLTTNYSSPQTPFNCCGDEFTETAYTESRHAVSLAPIHLEIATNLLNQPGMPPSADANEVALALAEHTASHAFWQRARDVSSTTDTIRQVARAAGVSEAAVGAGYLRMQFNADAVSPGCHAGVWQLPIDQPGLRIEQCTMRGTVLWDGQSPPVVDGHCQVLYCAVDERLDLERSTTIALQGDWMAGLSPSRVIAVYALLTCVTDSPNLVCEHIGVPPVGG